MGSRDSPNYMDKKEYDKMDKVERRDKLNEIKTPPVTDLYRIKYEKIKWKCDKYSTK